MIAKQVLWFNSRKEFYDWVVGSELAISEEELETNEKKKFMLLPPLDTVVTYLDLTNYFVCDNMQTIVWMKKEEEEGKEPTIQAVPIMINSDKLEID